MQIQIENLSNAFDINDISTVVGFKKNLIMERFPDVNYIYNPFFDRTNTSKSLLKALVKCKNESVLWLNGDVVFDEEILDYLAPHIDKNISFVAVNKERVAEEEVKYTLKNGFIHELSKEVKNGLGEALGINFISNNDLPSLINRLEECDANDYFERGIELAIKNDGIKVNAIDISQFNCVEIDFQEDLENANQLI